MTLGVSRLPCKYVPFKSSIYRKSLFVRFSNISFCNFVRFSNISRKTTFFSFCILMIHMILVIGRKQMHSTNYYGPFWSKRNLTAYFISDRIKIEKGTTDKRLVQRYMYTLAGAVTSLYDLCTQSKSILRYQVSSVRWRAIQNQS